MHVWLYTILEVAAIYILLQDSRIHCTVSLCLQTPLVYFYKSLNAGFDNPTLAAVSNIVTFANPNEPLHGHLALTNNVNEMV